jgi:hypothetical protein
LDDSLDDSSVDRELPPDALVGVVETALAEALVLAARAGRWTIVAQIARELELRRGVRQHQASQVVDLADDESRASAARGR